VEVPEKVLWQPQWAWNAAWAGATVAVVTLLGLLVVLVSFGPYMLLGIFLGWQVGAGAGLGLVFLVTFIRKGGQAMLAAGLFMVAIGALTALQLLGVFN